MIERLVALNACILLIFFSVTGQSPDRMSFQAVIRDGSGALVSNGPAGIKISVLQGSVSGTEVYSETHSEMTNTNGLITLEIGGGTVISGIYEDIDWGNGPYYLKREIDPLGGTNYVVSGTSQFLSVPYAIFAMKADTVLKVPDSSVTNEIQVLSISNDTIYLSEGGFVQLPISNPGPIMDIDGNVYGTIQIGEQVWMKENLKTSRYNTGSPIPNEVDEVNWSGLSTGAWCFYNNDGNNNGIYGKLYNWYAVETGNLCPSGWHVPTDAEWNILTDTLGGLSIAGGKLKELGTVHWDSPNTGATDDVGFTALPGGARSSSFGNVGGNGYWWSASPGSSNNSWSRFLNLYDASVRRFSSNKRNGFSIRCLRD